jgi:hypothetical protein
VAAEVAGAALLGLVLAMLFVLHDRSGVSAGSISRLLWELMRVVTPGTLLAFFLVRFAWPAANDPTSIVANAAIFATWWYLLRTQSKGSKPRNLVIVLSAVWLALALCSIFLSAVFSSP